MARRMDVQKHQQWRERLERFESRSVSVAQFCRDEGVTQHVFYYWAKRLRGSANQRGNGMAHSTRSPASKTNELARSTKRRPTQTAAEDQRGANPSDSLDAIVHFTWESGLQVSVPADCLQAIRCVLEFTPHERRTTTSDPATTSAFRQVIVNERE